MLRRYDFANILFAGVCNLHCPYCIGQQIDPALNRNNLAKFPLHNLERFAGLLKKHGVTEVVFTGTTTDPQLYRYEQHLLAWLKERLPPVKTEGGLKPVRYALHTNGVMALRKMDIFNQYDRVCISFPSFKADSYHKMTGSATVPNLPEIVRQAQIPVKLSCIINEHNQGEVDEYLENCLRVGIKRLVFRRLCGELRHWDILGGIPQVATYRNNPVYDYHGMEVTYWSFQQTDSASLNLFSNGVISPHYLLSKAN